MSLHAEQTALTLVDAHAARDPGHRAVLFDEEVLTYGELVAASRRLAQALIRRGIRPRDRICLLASNSPDYYVAYFAVLRCGAALFPINTDLALDEIGYIIDHSDPALIITDEALAGRALEAVGGLARTRPLARLDVLGEEGRALDDGVDFPRRSSDDVALVVHTSGTTARPKGVLATDRMEVLSAQALQRCWDIRPGDISVCALPLSYTFGLFSASFAALCAGATVLLLRKFNPVRVLESIVRHRATYMVGVPTLYAMMLEHVQQTGLAYDLSSMRMMAASGAPIALKVKEDFQATFGVVLRDYYALSECTPIFSFDLRGDPRLPPPGAVGRLVDGAEVALLGDDGLPVAAGDIGALRLRSERLMPGYYRDPERTALAFEDGWFKTGDLAWRDVDGHYFIVGRDRDQVISGGHKIASTEVESLIARIPAVKAVAVVGAPHPVLGEIVRAVVVCREGEPLDAAAVIAFCQAHLAAYKVPREVLFRADLPVSPAGKVLKRALI